MALVAFTRESDKPVQQGVARYIINPDGTSCEFAIVVSDKRQHQGIGTMLMKALMDAACAQRLTVMEGKVLATNRSMLQLMSELDFTIERSADEPDIQLVQRRL
jgi:acetyltransferase